MKIGDVIKVTVGDDGHVELRQPTNVEWNAFDKARYPMGRGNRLKDKSGPARVELFDTLCVGMDNIEDNEGPITPETKGRFPARLKAQIIFQAFEAAEEIEIKN